jgi:hypothetical protein
LTGVASPSSSTNAVTIYPNSTILATRAANPPAYVVLPANNLSFEVKYAARGAAKRATLKKASLA